MKEVFAYFNVLGHGVLVCEIEDVEIGLEKQNDLRLNM